MKKCLKCGYVRSKNDPGPDDECPRCGDLHLDIDGPFPPGSETKLNVEVPEGLARVSPRFAITDAAF